MRSASDSSRQEPGAAGITINQEREDAMDERQLVLASPQTRRLFEVRGNRICRRSDGFGAWPDDPGCTCAPSEAEYDPLSGALYVSFAPAPGCPVHDRGRTEEET